MEEYILSNEELRKLQLTQLEMLIEVDRICKKCNIKYNIIAGTLLGAVRHKGYIPWDDDADVGLLRHEYEKFKNACKTELDADRFYFQDHIETKGYRWGYGKLRRKGTCFLRENQEHMPYEQGIFIDIFPLDGVPDFYPSRIIHNFVCFLFRKIFWSAVGRFSNTNYAIRSIYNIFYKIPTNLVFSMFDKFIIYSNQKRTKFVRILTFPTPNIVFGYRRKWYLNSKEYEFENNKFMGIRAYKQYLKFKYGNYEQIPPVEMRKVHPVTKLDLN